MPTEQIEDDAPEITTSYGPSAPSVPGGITILYLAGLAALLTGLYYLLVAPGDETNTFVNLHRLTLGETFTIVGAIFLAAAFRPYHRE